MKDKYYTTKERSEALGDSYTSDKVQKKFFKYKKKVARKIHGASAVAPPYDKTEYKLGLNAGFNACLKMIEEDTDIDWSTVKWRGLYSSMVSWFSALGHIER